MPFQKGVRYAAPLEPPDDGLPNWSTTIRVTTMPAGPRTRRRTAVNNETTRMMSDRIGQAIQNASAGNPSSQYVMAASTRSPVTAANPSSHSPRHRPDADPTELVSMAADM